MKPCQLDMLVHTLQYLARYSKMTEFHHGDCVGADEQAHTVVRKHFNCSIHGHIPVRTNSRAYCKFDVIYKAKPYLVRNHDIVDMVDLLLAAPYENTEVVRSGTWATVRYARKVNRELIMLRP